MPRARTTLAIVILVASAVWLGVRHLPNPFARKPDIFTLDPDQRQLLKEARAAYAAYPTITFTESTTPADIQAVLDAAPDQPIPAATPQIPATLTPDQARRHRAELSRLMAEFLLYAVHKDDADAYIEWRLGRGDRLMTIEEMEHSYMLGESWTYLAGEPQPADLTSREAFRFFFDHFRSERAEGSRIVGILNHPDAAFTQLWFANMHISYLPPYPDPLGEPGWVGSQIAGGPGYFRGTIDAKDLYAEHAPTLMARCGVVVVNETGIRQPLILSAFRSTSDGHWNIHYVHLGNCDPDAMPGLTW